MAKEVDVTEINADNVIELLERAVARKGADYRYREGHDLCQNAERDRNGSFHPSCIVGHVIDLVGGDLSRMSMNNDVGGTLAHCDYDKDGDGHGLTEYRIVGYPLKPFIPVTPEAMEALQAAQLVQDEADQMPHTWGEALEAAKAVLGK